MRNTVSKIILAILLFSGAVEVSAEIPQVISVQGRLTDSAGVTVSDGPQLVRFNIYSDSSNGAALWSSSIRQINVTDGLFSYNLGDTVALPNNLFDDTTLWLGIKVGTDPEMTPRIRLTSGSYVYRALKTDSADAVDWSGISNIPAGFADGTDDGSSYTAGSGLQLVGNTFSVLVGGITTSHIANGAITNVDIDDSADIEPTKISGTAASLQNNNVFEGLSNVFRGQVRLERRLRFTRENLDRWTFSEGSSTGLRLIQERDDFGVPVAKTRFEVRDDGTFEVGDGMLVVNEDGIHIGDGSDPTENYIVRVEQSRNTGLTTYGSRVDISNSGDGNMYGFRTSLQATAEVNGGNVYGFYSDTWSDGSFRYGLRAAASANDFSISTGTSYGVYGRAWDGNEARGVYGRGTSAETNWAGYFSGDINVTGSVVKAAGKSRIDHPLDPENKYLQHTAMESPDMLNVYSGSVNLDGSGSAFIQLPEYFEMINDDFRYQLTPIGSSMPELFVAEEIKGNQFRIAGGMPDGKVSWEVTAVRQDNWAKANRTQVEMDKPDHEKGLYLHYEEHGQPMEMSVEREELLRDRELRQTRGREE